LVVAGIVLKQSAVTVTQDIKKAAATGTAGCTI